MRQGLLIFFYCNLSLMGAEPQPRVGERLPRRGDEIMVCGQLFHTTTKVVLWTDPGGYDAYRVERRFGPRESAEEKAKAWAKRDSNASERGSQRYGMRTRGLTPEQIEKVRGGGWDLPLLQQVVDQFVIHFDARGTSARCFQVLQDQRGLSVQFMLDLDGTIYQTLDAKEAAWHATIANSRSIGIEVANIGAYKAGAANPLGKWYQPGPDGKIRIIDPEPKAIDPIDPSAGLRPSRDGKVVGAIQGEQLEQYDFTPQQYEALAKLAATLCTVFPKIRCDYPRDQKGNLIPHKLPADQLANYHGILGHYHVQTNKVDPGPAFQWDRLIDESRRLMAR
ncbi:MAG: N-acetylmuramoyl-L-alanine amidase [Isosphaeraceae bacterium]